MEHIELLSSAWLHVDDTVGRVLGRGEGESMVRSLGWLSCLLASQVLVFSCRLGLNKYVDWLINGDIHRDKESYWGLH